MSLENPDFWKEQLKDVDMDGLGFERNLSDASLQCIKETHEATVHLSQYYPHLGKTLVAESVKFARTLGASEEEIQQVVLPMLFPNPKPEPKRSSFIEKIKSVFKRT